MNDTITEILKLLDDIDGFAANSRGCYENARGNDSLCYAATKKIRDLLVSSSTQPPQQEE